MKPSVFVSYSRREAPFVNDLVANIEKNGYVSWLDYRSLVPGKAWQQQILDGIHHADIFLLVVSKESIASKNVEREWREAITQQKRIILLLFEAVQLPTELKDKVWIDFRTSFNQSIKALFVALESPISQSSLPPEKGFKAPVIVWVSFFAALILSILSITTVWTLYLPYYLFPLPYRILKRDFDFAHVQGAIFILPFFTLWNLLVFIMNSQISEDILSLDAFSTFLIFIFFISIPTSILLLVLTRTPGMQRWGKPIATSSKFRNRYKPLAQDKKAVTYFLDHAPQDTKYALAIARILGKDSHRRVDSEDNANIVLVLISRFKKKSVLNPEEKVVYPILLQETHSIDARLQAIQWVDFRRGIRRMKQFSSLIGKPTMILKALGVLPSSQQTVLPTVIQGINYFLTFLSMVILGGVVFLSILDLSDIFSASYIGRLVATLIFLLVIDSVRRDIVHREGRIVRSTRTLLLSIFTMSLIVNIITSTSLRLHGISPANNYQALEYDVALSAGFSLTFSWSYYAAVSLTLLMILIYWRDLKRWIPFQQPQSSIYVYILRDYFARGLVILLISIGILLLP